MSAKWIRARKWEDEHLTGWLLPAKLLLRTFETIPLAVVLLSLVAVFGILASVTLGLIALIPTYLVYGATVLGTAALLAALPTWGLIRGLGRTSLSPPARFAAAMITGVALLAASLVIWRLAIWPSLRFDPEAGTGLRLFGSLVDKYKSVQFRRLPIMEMSELEFYAWWPLRVVLLLFVVNMVVTTLRRIEFRFPYLGVLTVHTGIVFIAIGAMYYAAMKQEGDMLLMAAEPDEKGRPREGSAGWGPPETGFYDNTDVALWVSQDPSKGWEQRPLRGVPRYNDYNLNALGLKNRPPMAGGDLPDYGPISVQAPDGPASSAGKGTGAVDADVRFRVIGYASHADLIEQWVGRDDLHDPASATSGGAGAAGAGGGGTAVRIVQAFLTVPTDPNDPSSARPNEPKKTWRLLPDIPAERVDLLEVQGQALLGIEYTRGDTGGRGMTAQRWADLSRSLPKDAMHALVVRHPASGFEEVYAIRQGQRLAVGDTGYQIEVTQLLPSPPFPIITRGYQGARSSVAVVRVMPPPDRKSPSYERWVYHRFPEISQDLVDPPDGTPGSGAAEGQKPMGGQRRSADPELEISYVDASIVQIYLDESPDGTVRSIVRVPGGAATVTPSIQPGGSIEPAPGLILRLGDRLDQAVLVEYPFSTPQARRDTKAIGNHQRAALAVEVTATPAGGVPVRRVLWVPFAQYARTQQSEMQRVIGLADGRRVHIMFGRVRHEFWPPMAVRLADFEMIPYPHSQTPRDYRSELIVLRRWAERHEDVRRVTSLNEPLLERTPFQPRDGVPAAANAAGWMLSWIAPNQYKFSQAGWDQTGWTQSRAAAERGEIERPMARYTILGVGNNPGIYIIATGAVMMSVGIPWAFYVKPWLMRREKRRLKELVSRGGIRPRNSEGAVASINGSAGAETVKSE